ncbi:MAG: hypothetical protein QOG12_784 [Verrucomicrobiota bacterium]
MSNLTALHSRLSARARWLLLILAVLVDCGALSAAPAILPTTSSAVTVLPPVNLRELAVRESNGPWRPDEKEIEPPQARPELHAGVPIPDLSSVWRTPRVPTAPGLQSPPVSRSFKSDSFLGTVPPDTMGAVGHDAIITTTNEKIVVQDRSGVVLSSVSINAFWASSPGSPNPNVFDPKVLYDRFNRRFILVAEANSQSFISETLIAISQTADPAGSYYRYVIKADPNAFTSGGKWADYPSVGFNKNWIAVQVNLFGFGSITGYQGPALYVLDKAAAYNGTPGNIPTFTASYATCIASSTQEGDLGCGLAMAPATTEDNTTETLFLTEDWDSTAGQLRLSKITGTPSAPVLTVGFQFPQAPNSWRFDSPTIGTSGGYVLQRKQDAYLAADEKVATSDTRIQNAVLRNGSLWAVQHVLLPSVPTAAGTEANTPANPDDHTGIQWWQINPTVVNSAAGTPPLQWARIEDPAADNCHDGTRGTRAGCVPHGEFFSFPTISVNASNDVLIGYSRFSEVTLPKSAYSFRAASDPANTMRDSQTFREGVASYALSGTGAFKIRWGDFSATMVDPINDNDFWTIQEYADFKREIFPNQFSDSWATSWALVQPASTTSTSGDLIISEFRFSGPAGTRDEFVELYNPSSSPLTVSTIDGSTGWALAASADGATFTPLAAIPNGTTIPSHGHYLLTNRTALAGLPPYSLEAYPNTQLRLSDADAMWTPDIAQNGGIAIFRTANPANFAVGTRMDSAGFANIAPGLFKEGAGIPNIAGAPAGQMSFVRSMIAGAPQDTQANENDFVLVDPAAETLGAQPILGAAGPEDLQSPIHSVGDNLSVALLDPGAGDLGAPNVVYNSASDPANNSPSGTITIRRRFANHTGRPLTRLRFRLADITTAGSPGASPSQADLRARTSPGPEVISLIGGGTITVQPATLETPPPQSRGGGLGSSLAAGSITLATPLPDGAEVPLSFLFGIAKEGFYHFTLLAEALPGASTVLTANGCAGSVATCGTTPTLSVDDVTIVEGNGGSANAVFTVSLSSVGQNLITVNFATADGTATSADNDYVPVNGSLSFVPGETTKSITVAIVGDAKPETNETFSINLSSPANAVLGKRTGQGTITNDDHATPGISNHVTSATILLGESTSDTATLVGGFIPSGSVTFSLFGPDSSSCAGAPVFSTVRNVNGNGDYVSASFTPTAPGVYRWIASYGGDSANNAVTTACGDSNGSLQVVVPPARLVNVSTRARIESGANNSVIGGFIITGNAPRKVIVRGLGPSLQSHGITDYLANPTLELHSPTGAPVFNQDWSDTQQAAIAATGLAPSFSVESAIVATLEPGDYTAILSGLSGGTGLGLIEVYDLDSPGASKLANLSTRASVNTGANVLIGGFVLSGDGGARQIVIRALGPSLAGFGIADFLPDPTVELRDAAGTLLLADDDWQDDSAQATGLAGAGLAPKNAKEAALITTLGPGAYTAIVQRKSGTSSGVGLVEIYDVP